MVNFKLFIILSLPVVFFSWRSLFNMKNHGFYRFFCWECILFLFSSVCDVWFKDALSFFQLISWALLLVSLYLVVSGAVLLHKIGKPGKERAGKELYHFERTNVLVDKGVFKYIRHPLYSSLLLLTWAILLKGPSALLIGVAALSTVFLTLTALAEEKECIEVFGDRYKEYMKRTKRFIPYII